MTDAGETRLMRELRTKLNAEIDQKSSNIAQGALPDHAAYRHACGIVKGLRDALALAEEIDKRMNGDR